MKPALTGFQRFKLVRKWSADGKIGDKEDYIKKVCEAKGLTYVPPIKITRSL